VCVCVCVCVCLCVCVCDRLGKDLIHEAQMHRLRHPNIVMLLAVIFEPRHYGVVFEYVTYGGLDSFIEDYLVGFCLLELLHVFPDNKFRIKWSFVHVHTLEVRVI